MSKYHCLEVWGDLACFTRPELKVERFSYPVITPSAGRAIFEAIYWKPRFRWHLRVVELLTPPRYLALRRNEVKEKVPAETTLNRWRLGKAEIEPIWADASGGSDQKGRTQRQTMALKDVRFRLHAEMVVWPQAAGELTSLEAQFRRRAARGQCHSQPYFGCREFPAYFRLVEDPSQEPPPLELDLDLGWMLYDVFERDRYQDSSAAPSVSAFEAKVVRGRLEVPEYSDPRVRKPQRREAR